MVCYQSLCHSFQHISAHNLEACQSLSGVLFVTPEEERAAKDDQKMQWWSYCSVSLPILGPLDSMQISEGWCEMHTRISIGPTSWDASCYNSPSLLCRQGPGSVLQSQPSPVFQIRLYFGLCVCVRVSGCQIAKLIKRRTGRSCIFFLLTELLAGSLSGQSLWKQVRKRSDWLAVQITTMAVRKPQGEL